MVFFEAQQGTKEWSKLYGRSISQQEYCEMCHNLNGFFSTLKKWDDEEKMRSENERNKNNRSMCISYQTD